ncbi:hypothetical protein IAT38_003055 [Cryptococcus sp. DSM 104549]
MSTPTSPPTLPASPSSRLRLGHSPLSASASARNSIMSSSAKGWSPLQINKRDSTTGGSPLRASPTPSPLPGDGGPRRSSNSFKLITKGNLVSNSPFKSPTTAQGAQAAGLYVEPEPVIHERRSARQLGEAAASARGVGSTPKAAIGLGISAAKPASRPRQSGRVSSGGSGAAVTGQRKVSAERAKVSFPTAASSSERRVSGERKTSGSKENESPDVRYGKRIPRASMGLKGLAQGSLVSKSPFKRVPSGGLSATASTRTNETPSPAKSATPVEMDDVFSSPSPRRVSGGKQQPRRASPSASLGARTSHSHSTTPSPPRSGQPLLVPGGTNGPSPLSRTLSVSPTLELEPTPTPTPHKSAMTPSRRLRGPRDHLAGAMDSPSKKTVTFQVVPDVKEFETMSAEPSMDGSFDVGYRDAEEDEDEGEWVDEGMQRENSLDDMLAESEEAGGDGEADGSTTAAFMDTLVEEGLFSPPDMDAPAFEDQAGFELPLEPESDDRPFLTTPSLGESVRISPMFDGTEVFGETDGAGIPYGRTHHAERAAEAHRQAREVPSVVVQQPELPHNEEHRMLLNADASQPAIRPAVSPVHSPPAFYPEYNDPFASFSPQPTYAAPAHSANGATTPHAHQAGPIPDPFITIQTATAVLPTEHKPRDEGGVPLGRTSHLERIQAARMLATQKLGLGMPGRPNAPMSPSIQKEAVQPQPQVEEPQYASEEEEKEEPFDAEMLFDASFEMGGKAQEQTREEERKEEKPARRLPKVPAPMPIDVPSPVTSPMKQREEEMEVVDDKAEKRKSTLDVGGFSLPFIGSTSPFFNQTPAFERQQSESTDGHAEAVSATSGSPSLASAASPSPSPEIANRPLTPPPALRDPAREQREDSPHRLPDFNFHFEEIQLQSVESGEVSRGVVRRGSVKPMRVGSEERAMGDEVVVKKEEVSEKEKVGEMPSSISASSLKSEFGATPTKTRAQQDSTTTRVRQRISREMIRETIQQRIADGSLSRKHASMDMAQLSKSFSATSIGDERRERRVSNVDKDLPAPPPDSPAVAFTSPASKRHTMDVLSPTRSAISGSSPAGTPDRNRPAMRPRSQTQSAHEVFQREREGGEEPKSALEKLALAFGGVGGGKKSAGEKVGEPATAAAAGEREREVSGSIAAEMPPPPIAKETTGPVSILRNPSGRPDSVGSSSTGNAMEAREQAIVAKRREQAGRKVCAMSTGSRRSRRSMSTGDVGEEAQQAKSFRHSVMGNPRLTLGIDDEERSILEAFREETANAGSGRGYKVRERHVVRATYKERERLPPSNAAGDLEVPKAWKSLRRPSDLHEHSAAIRAMRALEADTGKPTGTIFVKVLGIEGLAVPLPEQQTFFCVTLDNGIDYIRTPYGVLTEGARVNQEFSLVEHANFEFSLSIDIRRDPHILKLVHEKANPAPVRPITPASPAKSHGGFRSLFASPRKPKGPQSKGSSSSRDSRSSTPVPPPAPAPVQQDTLANYLPDPSASTIAKTHIQFKSIAKNCDARVLEIRYPLFAMFKGEAAARPGTPAASSAASSSGSTGSGNGTRKQLAKITLQVFRLPPIPGLGPEELPQCIDDCLRGLRYHAWHEHEYHEGVLTQEGGDCTHPKRRLFKLIGGNLVAINEVTKKQVSKIDLRLAVGVVDLNVEHNGSPKSRMTMRPRGSDEGLGVRPRSFEVEFKDGEVIVFSADTDALKDAWMSTLEGLIGKIPSNPLWAELLTMRQREKAAKRSASSGSLAKEGRRVSGKTAGMGGRPMSSVAMGGAGARTR